MTSRDEDQLVRENLSWVSAEVRRWFAAGMDFDDLLQEALGALVVATRTYQDGVGSFRGFARMVVRRRLIEIVRASRRVSRGPLDGALRAITCEETGHELTVDQFAPDVLADVEDLSEHRAQLRAVMDRLPRLTEAERRAIVGIVIGVPYLDLPGTHNQVDNAAQRARRKLRSAA